MPFELPGSIYHGPGLEKWIKALNWNSAHSLILLRSLAGYLNAPDSYAFAIQSPWNGLEYPPLEVTNVLFILHHACRAFMDVSETLGHAYIWQMSWAILAYFRASRVTLLTSLLLPNMGAKTLGAPGNTSAWVSELAKSSRAWLNCLNRGA